MDILLGVLETLKINNSIWVQLGCFLVAYLALSNLLFKPYYEAYQKRQSQTVGGEEEATSLAQEADEIREKYEAKLREVNSQTKGLFDSAKDDAIKEQLDILTNARNAAEHSAHEAQGKIQVEVDRAKSELKNEVGPVSQAIASRLVGKELN